MSAINWNDVNKRILVIGKFSEMPEFKAGAKILSKSFISDIKPGYYRKHVDDAIKFDNLDGGKDFFGGFEFSSPADPPAEGKSIPTPENFIPITVGSPLFKIAGKGNDVVQRKGKDVVQWAKSVGEQAYKDFYGYLKHYQKAIAQPDFCSLLLTEARTYVEKHISSITGSSVTRSVTNAIVNANISAVLTYLFSANTQLSKLICENRDVADGVARCLQDFKNLHAPGGAAEDTAQSICEFYGALYAICEFLADPVKIPAILIWMIAEKGKSIHKLGDITDLPGLNDVASREYLKIEPKNRKVDLAALAGQTTSELTNLDKEIAQATETENNEKGKDTVNQALRDALTLFSPEAQSASIEALSLSYVYERRTLQEKLVENYSEASVVVSKAGAEVVRRVKEFAEEVLKSPILTELAIEFWEKGNTITEDKDLQKLASVLGFVGKDYKAADWEDFSKTKDVPSQVLLFFEKYRKCLVSKMLTPVETNLKTIERDQLKSEIIFGAILYSGSPQGDGYGLMPLPTDLSKPALANPFNDGSNWLSSYCDRQVSVIKKKVLQVAEDSVNDIQWALLELHKEGQDLNKIERFIDGSEGKSNAVPLLPAPGTEKQQEQAGDAEQQDQAGKEEPGSEEKKINGGDDKTGELLATALKPFYEEQEEGQESDTRTKVGFKNKETGHDINWTTEYAKPEIDKALDKINVCLEVAKDDTILRAKTEEFYADSFQLISGKSEGGTKKIPDGEKYALPILLGNIICTLPNNVVNFGKKHVAQEYMLLWKLVKEYGSPEKDVKEKLAKILFEEVFPIRSPDALEKVFRYYHERCAKVLELAQYAKRIDDLEELSKSGAEVWVINNTLDTYINNYSNKDILFWEKENVGKKSVIDETHIVYVTKDAGGIDALTKYLPTAAVDKIAYYPLFFFEYEALAQDLKKNSPILRV